MAFGRRKKIKFHTFRCTGKHKAMNCKNNNKHKKSKHHYLRYSFKSVLQTKAANDKSGNNNYFCPEYHFSGIGKKSVEHTAYRIGRHSRDKRTFNKFGKVIDHPAGYRCIIHHKKITADHTEPAHVYAISVRAFQAFYMQGQHFFGLPCQPQAPLLKQEHPLSKDR